MVRPEEVYKYYKISDAFITASTSETQGLTYIEVMASWCPVICKWDKCIDKLVINNQTGFTYNDDLEFKDAVIKLRSKEYQTVLSNKCIIKAEEYSAKKFASKVEGMYCSKLLYDRIINEAG